MCFKLYINTHEYINTGFSYIIYVYMSALYRCAHTYAHQTKSDQTRAGQTRPDQSQGPDRTAVNHGL